MTAPPRIVLRLGLVGFLAGVQLALGQSPTAAGEGAPAYQSHLLHSLDMESAALLLSGQEGGILPLRAAVLPASYEEGRLRVTVWAEVDLEPAAGGSAQLELAVYGLVGSEVRASDLRSFSLAGTGPRRVRLVTTLLLDPGTYSLRVLVRDRSGSLHGGRAGGAVGLRVLDVTVPVAGQPAVFSPLFLDAAAATLETLTADDAASPALAQGSSARAAPRSVVRGTATQPILIPIWQAGVGAAVVEVRKTGEPAGTSLPLTEPGPAPAGSLSFRHGDLPLDSLDAGDYELGTPGQTPVLRLRVTETLNAAIRPNTPTNRSGRRHGAGASAAQEYRRALGALVSGQDDEARRILTAFEVDLLRSGALAPEELLEIEVRIADALAKVSADAVLPAIAVALEMYDTRRRTGEPAAATHSRELAATMAKVLVDRGGDRRVAAQALIALAARLDETTPGIQRRILTAAVDLDPSAIGAWLSLAVGAERQGDFARAEQFAERMLDATAGAPAAQLRLAVYSARQGRFKDAQRRLEAAAAGKQTVTTRDEQVLRAQEASRIALATGALERAVSEARAGLAIAHTDEKLSLLLATALEALGRRSEAADILAAIQPSKEPNPRWVFTQTPGHVLATAGPFLTARAQAALPALERALAATAEPAALPGSR